MVTSLNVSVNALPQASVAVAVANTGAAGQEMVAGPGKGAITGGVLSCTIIVCEANEVFPQPSRAVHVRVTLYDPAQNPLVFTSLKVSVKALPQASVAVATANTGTAGQLIVEGAGSAAITGAVLS